MCPYSLKSISENELDHHDSLETPPKIFYLAMPKFSFKTSNTKSQSQIMGS